MTIYPTKSLEFTSKGVKFLQCGIDLETDIVTIKNLDNGKIGEIDYYKLEKLKRTWHNRVRKRVY